MAKATRGESDFARMPGFGAALYDRLMRGDALDLHYAELAEDVVARCPRGRLLDVGTGPARLLVEVARRAPALELFGLDVSAAMIARARANLGSVRADLRVGSIRRTDYPGDTFDAVVCSGSFYLWDEPAASLDEVFRILRPGASAHLYESCSDFDEAAFRAGLALNQASQGPLRRAIGGRLLRRQLRLTYSTDQVRELVARTRFAATATLERLTLARLPVYARVSLLKPA